MSGRARRSWGAPPDLRARMGLRVPRLSDAVSTENRVVTTEADYEALERGFCTSWNGANAGMKSIRAPAKGKAADAKDRCAWTTPHVLDERGQAVRMSLEEDGLEVVEDDNNEVDRRREEERVVVSDDDMDDAYVEYSEDEYEDEDVSFSRDHTGALRAEYGDATHGTNVSRPERAERDLA